MKYKKTKELLNQLVADLTQFSMIVHQSHWYMRGTNFLKLHPLMDDLMDELNDQLDEVAERLITLGGYPYSTLEEVLEHAELKSVIGSYDVSMSERLDHLASHYLYMVQLCEKGIQITDLEQDHVTQDLLIGFKGVMEKRIWMIRAELNQAPGLNK